jgi:thioesterase domain-containing protein
MLDLKQTEQIVHHKIPISKDIGVSLERFDTAGLIIRAPLINNINPNQTAFSGSLNAVAVLSCWTFLYLMLDQLEEKYPQIIIQKSSINYFKPVTTDFQAVCAWPDPTVINRFQTTYYRKKRARIELTSKIFAGNEPAIVFTGIFVAFSPG